ncbi:MAG TPA: acyl-CoA thioesterase domain-containing protein [Caulobacteraceae bacterium]
MESQPFFTREGERFAPTSASRGPWDEKSLHGRVIVGLLAGEIEARHGGPGYMPARLTVDMYRLPDLSPITVTTRLVRDGYRIKVIEAELISAGASMARGSCQLLRRTANPPGKVWSPPPWNAPAPGDTPAPAEGRSAMGGMWAMRPIAGAMGAHGPRRTWMAEVRPMVEGAALTPFVRAALAADFASPFANAGDAGLGYINSDVTLYLHRVPVGEWIGFEVVNHQATDGVAIGECWLYDEAGAIGSASVAALAQTRRIGEKPRGSPHSPKR